MKNIKNLTLSLLLAFTGGVSFAQNGLEGIIVEKYYVSNAADATGSIGALPAGSVTYRVFADMLPGYNFQAIYGVPGHTLLINTSTSFFNNEDRGNTTPAIGSTFLNDNSVALDTWFSVGGAANGQLGIPKAEDDGVSNLITGDPILLNADPSAGIPLGTQDGIVAGTPVSVTFVGLNGTDLNVFNATSNVGNSFTTSNGSIAALGGSVGPVPATNKVLIGQFTTDGCFHFELNIQIGTPTGGTQNYVSSSPASGEIMIPSLIYTSPPALTSSTVSYCVGASAVALTATPSAGSTLNWYLVPTGGPSSPTAPVPSTSAAGTTTYYVSQTNSGNESGRAAITVTVNPNPTAPAISASGATTFCTGNSVVLTSSASTGNMWSTTANTASITVSASGSYTVIETDGNGCQATSAATTVTVNPLPATPVISASGATSICAGNSVTLTSSAASGNTWSTTATTASISVNASGTYSVTETDGNGCQATSAATTVTVNPLPATPTISASGATSICAGNSVVLTSSAASGNMWSTTATTASITVNAAGTYSVTETDGNGCQATSAATTVTVNAAPTASGMVSTMTGSVVTFMNMSSGATSYTWNFGDLSPTDTATNPVHTYATNGIYTVMLIASNGTCTDTITFSTNITTGVAEAKQGVSGTTMYPNPAKDQTTISINLNEVTPVTINVIDVTGKVVINAFSGSMSAGENKVSINTAELNAGIYFTSITSGKGNKTLKLIVTK